MNNKDLLHKLLKYLVAGLIIYLILCYIPNITQHSLGENTAITIALIIVLIYVIFDNLWNYFYGNINVNSLTEQERTGLCSSVCSAKLKPENMNNVNKYVSLSQDMEKLGDYMNSIGEKMPNVNNSTHSVVSYGQPLQPQMQTQQIPPQTQQQTPPQTQQLTQQLTDENEQSETNEQTMGNQYKEKMFNELLEYIKNKTENPQNQDNPFASNNKIHCQFQNEGTRSEDGLINDDTGYAYNNHFPLAVGFDSVDYEYGYSFLPPSQWYPKSPTPPVCVTDKQCLIQPVYTVGSPVDMKEWDSSRRIMPPDRINIDYIKKLNGGR